jgi:ABC-type thiamine transport system substrate-binding protein
MGAQAAIAVNAQGLVAFAAICVAAAAGIATLAIQVRFDGATLARPQIPDTFADGHDFDAEFVSGNSRVAEVGHLAQKSANVRAANADAMYAHQGFVRTWRRRLGNVDHAETARLFQLDGFHKI